MIKAILDTNVIVSAIVFGGKPREVLNLVIEGKVKLFLSKPIVDEVKEILGGRKFRFGNPYVTAIGQELESISEIVYPQKRLRIIKEDPDDDMFIECAVAARADYIISGDKHLLNLLRYDNIKIVNAADFINIAAGKN